MDNNILHGMFGSLGAGEAMGFDVGAGGYDDWWDDDDSFRQGVFHNLGSAAQPKRGQLDVGLAAAEDDEFMLDPAERQYVRQTQATLTTAEQAAWNAASERGVAEGDIADAINEIRTRAANDQPQQQSNGTGRKLLIGSAVAVAAVVAIMAWRRR